MPYRGYTLKELTLVPRPLRLPVETWQPIQGGSARALEFMAKHGIQGMVGGGSAEGGAMHKVVLGWQEAHAKMGKQIELGERLCFGFHFYMADSRQDGIRKAAKYYEENMKMFGELRLVRAMTDEQVEIMRDPKRAPTAKLPRIEDAVNAGGFLTGSASEIIDQLKELEAEISGAGPRIGEPFGRRAEIRGAGAVAAVRRGSDAGVREGEGNRAGAGQVGDRAAGARLTPPLRRPAALWPQPVRRHPPPSRSGRGRPPSGPRSARW